MATVTENVEPIGNERARLIEPDAPVEIKYHEPPRTDDAGLLRRRDANAEFLRKSESRYVVASGAQIDLGRAGKLTAGMACDVQEHLQGAQAIANKLSARGILLELDADTLRARTCSARYRIHESMFREGGCQSVVLRSGVKIVGDGVLPLDYAVPGFEGRIGQPGFPELPSVKPTEGMERFAAELALGHIVDRGPSFGPHFSGGPEPIVPAAPRGKVA